MLFRSFFFLIFLSNEITWYKHISGEYLSHYSIAENKYRYTKITNISCWRLHLRIICISTVPPTNMIFLPCKSLLALHLLKTAESIYTTYKLMKNAFYQSIAPRAVLLSNRTTIFVIVVILETNKYFLGDYIIFSALEIPLPWIYVDMRQTKHIWVYGIIFA